MEPIDVLISNATLHWVPGHLKLLPQLARAVAPGGWFAFQVPGKFRRTQPHHSPGARDAARIRPVRGIRLEGRRSRRWHLLTRLDRPRLQRRRGETTYLHVLHGRDPVFEWVATTSARPTLDALPADLRARFEAEFKSRLNDAYPVQDGTVVLPFRRVFVVARVPSGTTEQQRQPAEPSGQRLRLAGVEPLDEPVSHPRMVEQGEVMRARQVLEPGAVDDRPRACRRRSPTRSARAGHRARSSTDAASTRRASRRRSGIRRAAAARRRCGRGPTEPVRSWPSHSSLVM